MPKFVVYLIGLTILSACDFRDYGLPGCSHSVQESVERSVFVAEYEVTPKSFVSGDGTSVQIQSVWLEHNWSTIPGPRSETPRQFKRKLCFTITPDKAKGLFQQWYIGSREEYQLGAKSGTVYLSGGDWFQDPPDTFSLPVRKGPLRSNHTDDLIVELQLVRKD